MLGCIARDSAGAVNNSDGGTIDGTSDALVNISMCSRADDYVHLWYSSARAFGCLMPPPETLRVGVSTVIRSPTVADHVPDEGKAGHKGPAC